MTDSSQDPTTHFELGERCRRHPAVYHVKPRKCTCSPQKEDLEYWFAGDKAI